MPLVTSAEMFKKAYEGHYAVGAFNAVSYTHLTLPTIYSVQISVVAVSLTKKTEKKKKRKKKIKKDNT